MYMLAATAFRGQYQQHSKSSVLKHAQKSVLKVC